MITCGRGGMSRWSGCGLAAGGDWLRFAGAELVMDRVPLEARCEACGRAFVVEAFRFECPGCHSPDTVVVRGEGLILESVTMEGCDP